MKFMYLYFPNKYTWNTNLKLSFTVSYWRFSSIFEQDKVYHWPKSSKLCSEHAGSHHFYITFYIVKHLQQINYSAFIEIKYRNDDIQNKKKKLF